MKNTYQILRERIVELVPEIVPECTLDFTIADLLVAIGRKGIKQSYFIRDDGTIFEWEGFADGGNGHHSIKSTYITLDLLRPFFHQSEETLSALVKLLK